MNSLRPAPAGTQDSNKQFAALLVGLLAPRLSWIKLIAPLMLLSTPLIFLPEPIKTYWLLADLALILVFFGVYFYRMALIRQRWLDKREVDEFGSYSAPAADDLYEPPST